MEGLLCTLLQLMSSTACFNDLFRLIHVVAYWMLLLLTLPCMSVSVSIHSISEGNLDCFSTASSAVGNILEYTHYYTV